MGPAFVDGVDGDLSVREDPQPGRLRLCLLQLRLGLFPPGSELFQFSQKPLAVQTGKLRTHRPLLYNLSRDAKQVH